MVKFFVGCKVKKVRGKRNLGKTGRILFIDSNCIQGLNLEIAMDSPWIDNDDETRSILNLGWGKPEQWEPILPEGHKPSEYSYEQLMDSLKEKVA